MLELEIPPEPAAADPAAEVRARPAKSWKLYLYVPTSGEWDARREDLEANGYAVLGRTPDQVRRGWHDVLIRRKTSAELSAEAASLKAAAEAAGLRPENNDGLPAVMQVG